MKLYQIAAFYVPKENADEKTMEKPIIIVPAEIILASDDQTASMIAARKIPESHVDKLEQVTVAVRPF